MFDFLPALQPGPEGPAIRAAVIVPADTTDLPMMARWIYVGTSGDINLVPRERSPAGIGGPLGSPVLLKNVPVGRLNVWTRQVFATGTTASNLVAMS